MKPKSEQNIDVEQVWYSYMMTGEPPGNLRTLGLSNRNFRKLARSLPKNPRCRLCYVPFEGVGGMMLKTLINSERSKLNPQICNSCEEFGRQYQGGAEVELSMLFVDVRGSTSIAEQMSTSEYSRLLNRFYNIATEKMATANALIEKMIGDEVTGLFVPGIAGIDHARAAVRAAREILLAAGYGSNEEPWIPLGAGVHTGVAFIGSVGSKDGLIDIAALGDDVNIAARLTAQAMPGEVIVSEKAWSMAGDLDTNGEIQELQLKGRSEPVKVRVLKF